MNMLDEAKKAAEWAISKANARTVTDALQNIISGIGTARDKSTWNRYVDSPILSVFDLETLYKDVPLARKIVEKMPRDALRDGFTVRRKGAKAGEADEEMVLLAERCNELKVTETLFKGCVWGRLFGGGGIVMSLGGTGSPRTPLKPENIRMIDFIRACDRQDFRPAYWAADGSTERWWWTRVSLGGGPIDQPVVDIHTSRILWFGGATTTDRARQRNGYWDLSILQAIFNTLVSYDAYWASLDAQVGDASQAVFHLQGFIRALAENSGETGEALRKRLQLMDMSRSNSRALVLDAGDKDGNGREDYTVIERASLANMDKLTGVYTNKVAADAGYPVSVLFEQAAAGTNATGESDLILYFNSVAVLRRNTLTTPATFLVRAVAREQGIADPEEIEVVWPALHNPKPLDIASAEKMNSDSLIGLVNAGIILEEEAALALPKAAPGLNLQLDQDARKEALEAGLDEVRDRTVMDPSEGEIAAQAKVKTAGQAAKGGPATNSSGRAVKAKANQSSAKPRNNS